MASRELLARVARADYQRLVMPAEATVRSLSQYLSIAYYEVIMVYLTRNTDPLLQERAVDRLVWLLTRELPQGRAARPRRPRGEEQARRPDEV